MKRFVCLITTFVLCFTINTNSVFAASMADPSGYDSWSTQEKVDYWGLWGAQWIWSIIGLTTGSSDGIDSVNRLGSWFYSCDDITGGYDSLGEFLAAKVAYNDDTETWTYDNDCLAFINYVKDEAESEITYFMGYLPNSVKLKADSFNTPQTYSIIQNIILHNPNKIFYVQSWSCSWTNPESGEAETGKRGWRVYFCDVPYGGVGTFSTVGADTLVKSTFYDSNWQNKFDCPVFYVLDIPDSSVMYYTDAEGDQQTIETASDAGSFDLDSIGESVNQDMISFVCFSSASWTATAPNPFYIFSSHTGGIPVFKSLADLKNGTSSVTCGQYLPGYSSGDITDNSVTQTEINDFSTNYNYYYSSGNDGDGSGDDGSGSGGSSGSGSWLDSIFSGLDSLGDTILNMFGKLSDFLGDAVSFITDGITSVLDLSQNGFVDLLTAFFPFLPKEWVTAVTLALGLSLFGLVIHMFKGG